jgi:hypothetical protein
MKTLTTLLLLLCLTSPAWPQAAAPEDPAHNELRAVRDGLLDAMAKGDIDRQLTYLHPNVVVTWHNAEVSRRREGVRTYLDRMLQGPNKVVASYSAEVTADELSILYGGVTAISWGSAVEHFKLASGLNFDLPARWSATLVKEDGKWLIANLHASDDLFDNPMLNAAKRTAYWAGGACLAVGLIVGMFVSRKRKRATT